MVNIEKIRKRAEVARRYLKSGLYDSLEGTIPVICDDIDALIAEREELIARLDEECNRRLLTKWEGMGENG